MNPIQKFLFNTGKQIVNAGGRYKRNLVYHPFRTIRNTSLAAGGAAVAGGVTAGLAFPQLGKAMTERLIAGPREALENTLRNSATSFADALTKQHPLIDKKTGSVVRDKDGKPIMVQGAIKRIAQAIGKNMTPALTNSIQPALKAMQSISQRAGQIGKSFGQKFGKGFKSSGGKVLTGAGAATLGYTMADLIQDYFQKGQQDPKKKRKRRVINILSSILAGTAGTVFSDDIYKFLQKKK